MAEGPIGAVAKKGKPPRPDPVVIKNATDIQRMKLQRLMENPDKAVIIPEPPKEKNLPPPPEFNRNVMGSSAGAGSGEFHVYRHIRRREYARQKFISEKAEKEDMDVTYHRKIEENRKKAEEKTAKKRAKRLKRKQNKKVKKGETKGETQGQADACKSSSDDDDEED